MSAKIDRKIDHTIDRKIYRNIERTVTELYPQHVNSISIPQASAKLHPNYCVTCPRLSCSHIVTHCPLNHLSYNASMRPFFVLSVIGFGRKPAHHTPPPATVTTDEESETPVWIVV